MNTKIIAIILLLVAGIGVTLFSVTSDVSTKNEYEGYVEKAQINADNDIPYVAATNFKKAFAIETPSEEIFLTYLEQMKKLGEDYELIALEEYLQMYPMSSNAYLLNLQRLYEQESYVKVVELALEAKEKEIATQEIKDYYTNAYYKYKYLRVGFEEAQSFIGNYALVKLGGLYGYLTGEGDYLIAPMYKDASIFLGSTAAVDDGNGYYMINAYGFKVAITSGPLDYMSCILNNKILAGKDGKFGYLSSDLVVPEAFAYDNATNFKNNVAAVCQNGKWALISSDNTNITDFIFEDVIRDEYNTCINNGVIFAKSDGAYYMYDATGKKISELAFEDACAFVGAQPAAVKIDGKWGFVNAKGEIVIEAKYENAGSYCCNLAPVCENGLWKYVDNEGVVRIEGDFAEAKPFSANGVAAIKEGEIWNYIKLVTF